jgi:hypothetical protein
MTLPSGYQTSVSGDPPTRVTSIAPLAPTDISRVIAAYERHLYVPDNRYLYAMFGAAVANLAPGDPTWLGLVDGPGGGKTEALLPLDGIPEVRIAGTITPASLLSGTSKKERAAHAKGGMLKEIGEFGIIVVKDFGSILTMHRDARAEALQALRDIYDGIYTRDVGSDGGQKLEWRGKMGFLFGATTAIDSHQVAMGALGERFLLHRLTQSNPDEKFDAAFEQVGLERAARAELATLTGGLIEEARSRDAPIPQEGDKDLLRPLAVFVAQARSAVERNGYSRELEFAHAPESPTRIGKELLQLLLGLDRLGVPRGISVPVVAKTALDSMQPRRLVVATYLLRNGERAKTSDIATGCGLPTSTCKMALEELAAHRVVHREKERENLDWWVLNEDAGSRLTCCIKTRDRYTAESNYETSEGVTEVQKPSYIPVSQAKRHFVIAPSLPSQSDTPRLGDTGYLDALEAAHQNGHVTDQEQLETRRVHLLVAKTHLLQNGYCTRHPNDPKTWCLECQNVTDAA